MAGYCKYDKHLAANFTECHPSFACAAAQFSCWPYDSRFCTHLEGFLSIEIAHTRLTLPGPNHVLVNALIINNKL